LGSPGEKGSNILETAGVGGAFLDNFIISPPFRGLTIFAAASLRSLALTLIMILRLV
jgi:hypothetical protein